jgi:tyrosinase
MRRGRARATLTVIQLSDGMRLMAQPGAPAPNAIVLRPSVQQANIGALRDAFAKMQALKAADNRSWIYWAEYHGFDRYDCWHHSGTGPPPARDYPYDLFLPWHRAYLNYFEHVVREQNPEAIPPWWDWTSASSHEEGIPRAYSEADINGGANPLASGPMPKIPKEEDITRTTRSPGSPAELPRQAEATREGPGEPPLPSVEAVLALPSYVDFSRQLQNLHDAVHGWTGGQMGVIATAAFDPIFWAHHVMIDRLWYLWQLRHGVSNIPPHYAEKVLAPFSFTVEKVLDVRALGYDYATSSAVGTPLPGPVGISAVGPG